MLQELKTRSLDALFRLKRFCLFLFSGLLLFSVVLMLVGGLMIHRAAVDWPQTEGRLQKFDVRPIEEKTAHLKIDVAFSYSVDGKDYQGQHLSAMTRPGKILWWRAKSKQKQYSVGRNVTIIYDPRDPSHSYLEAPDLFWDVLFIPISVGGLGAWLLYLFIKTKRRKVPPEIADRASRRWSSGEEWPSILESVIERDHVVVQGIATHSAAGGLFAGWPQCRVALIATPNQFAVVPGPYTKRGFASSILTLVLEFSLSQFWLPALHGTIFLFKTWRRRGLWRQVLDQRFSELLARTETVRLVSIDEAVVYGYDQKSRRLWYRLPGQFMDDFIQIPEENASSAEELIAYIHLMQNADIAA